MVTNLRIHSHTSKPKHLAVLLLFLMGAIAFFVYVFTTSRELRTLARGIVHTAQAQAVTTRYVDASAGTDIVGCGSAAGASACRTIMYLVNNNVLTGSTVVQIAPGIYREQVTVTAADDGTSDAARVVFRGAGVGQTIISGLDPSPLNDGSFQQCTAGLNCAGDGLAYPNVYRVSSAGRTIRNVWELAWQPFNIADPNNGAAYTADQPWPYTLETSVARVDGLAGAYLVSGGFLYIHTFFNEAPSVAGTDIETQSSQYAVFANGANFVTFEHMTVQYASTGFQVNNSDYIRIDTVYAHSAPNGVNYNYDSDFNELLNSEIADNHQRNTTSYTLPCAASCGWDSNGIGTSLKIDGSNKVGGVTGYTLRNLLVRNGWNLVSLEDVSNSVFEEILSKNTPNHAFIMQGDLISPTLSDCDSNILRRIVSFNTQDNFYISGCTNSLMTRSIGSSGFYNPNASDGPAFGWKAYSNLASEFEGWGYSVGSQAQPNFDADYIWFSSAANRCRWGDSGNNRQCVTEWPTDCNCNANGISSATVQFSGVTWPISNGLAAQGYVMTDFQPLAGSITIDAGNPDIDGDGLLETGSGGDDECIAAHNCAGSAPDIGPYEFGLSAAAVCGDGTIDPGESCDGANLGGNSCTTIPGGYTGGTLSCDPTTCAFVTSACTAPSGPVIRVPDQPASEPRSDVRPADASGNSIAGAWELDGSNVIAIKVWVSSLNDARGFQAVYVSPTVNTIFFTRNNASNWACSYAYTPGWEQVNCPDGPDADTLSDCDPNVTTNTWRRPFSYTGNTDSNKSFCSAAYTDYVGGGSNWVWAPPNAAGSCNAVQAAYCRLEFGISTPPGSTPYLPGERCGDGIRQSIEECDRGTNNGACPRTCSTQCLQNDCSGGGGPGCFAVGTMVLTPTGPRSIDSLFEGDEVVAYDETTGKNTIARVALRRAYARDHLYVINGTLQVTQEHRFAVQASNGTIVWTEVYQLRVGDLLRDEQGRLERINSIERYQPQQSIEVFNPALTYPHTYYVSMPGQGYVLVHNAKCRNCAPEI